MARLSKIVSSQRAANGGGTFFSLSFARNFSCVQLLVGDLRRGIFHQPLGRLKKVCVLPNRELEIDLICRH